MSSRRRRPRTRNGQHREARHDPQNNRLACTSAKFDIVDVKTVAEADASNTTTELIVAAIEG